MALGRHRKWFVIIGITFLLTTVLMTLFQRAPSIDEAMQANQEGLYAFYSKRNKSRGARENWRGLSDTEKSKLSVLGRILYLDEKPPRPRLKRQFTILVWKYGKTIENRHLRRFGKERLDPFDSCSVTNCQLRYDANTLNSSADLVIFHLHRMKKGDMPDPHSFTRPRDQLWAFLTDESPYHTFLSSPSTSTPSLRDYNGLFNWSMTYRMDSDIPVPYGRTVARRSEYDQVLPSQYEQHQKHSEQSRVLPSSAERGENDLKPLKKRRDVLVAIMGSNCGGVNNRWDYVKELQRHMAVDIYGACGKGGKTCPGHFKTDCDVISDYHFYLSFENANCDDYVTEKVWWNAYHKHSVPIVMGAKAETYRKLLPPASYLNVDNFAHPKDLARFILYLNATEQFRQFQEWRQDFRVLNEHGYFGSRSWHYCRACEALNYNDITSKKVYGDLDAFWNAKKDCHPAWNAP